MALYCHLVTLYNDDEMKQISAGNIDVIFQHFILKKYVFLKICFLKKYVQHRLSNLLSAGSLLGSLWREKIGFEIFIYLLLSLSLSIGSKFDLAFKFRHLVGRRILKENDQQCDQMLE